MQILYNLFSAKGTNKKETNKGKYLTLVPTNDSKEKNKNMKNFGGKTR